MKANSSPTRYLGAVQYPPCSLLYVVITLKASFGVMGPVPPATADRVTVWCGTSLCPSHTLAPAGWERTG